jgi:SAM-dependent methyltransferase
MSQPSSDSAFSGSIPQIYERYLVPLLFEPYAVDVAARVATRQPQRVLEIAAGTGVVTRQLADALPSSCEIVATDLNQAMVDQAAAVGTSRTVVWRTADAQKLPFPDGSFDAVVCQFGVMFFPDKSKAFSEARRVLRSGGVYIFNVWDRISDNEFADEVTRSLQAQFPNDPPRFLARVPYAYHDLSVVARELSAGGFRKPPRLETVSARSRADSPRAPAVAFCEGTPLRGEIESRGGLKAATETSAAAISRKFGSGAVDAKIQAHVVEVES